MKDDGMNFFEFVRVLILFPVYLSFAFLILIGCGPNESLEFVGLGLTADSSLTINPTESINSFNVSRFVIKGECSLGSSSNKSGNGLEEDTLEEDTELNQQSSPEGESTSLTDSSFTEKATDFEEENLEVSRKNNGALDEDSSIAFSESDSTDSYTTLDESENEAFVVKLSVSPINGKGTLSQQITCVNGKWATEAMDMTRFHQEPSLTISATQVLPSGEEAPFTALNIQNHFQCPWDYVPVPAEKKGGSKSFCVAKYEMKDRTSSIQTAFSNNSTGFLSKKVDSPVSRLAVLPQGQLVSQALGVPLTTSKKEAQVNCQKLGGNKYGEYDLIKNDEWQILARNIELVGSNWGDGSMGSSKGLNRGYSCIEETGTVDGLEASEDDTKACYGLPVYDDTTGQYVPMTIDSSRNSGQCDGPWHSRKRTHQLSNDEIIWDLAGNLCEWVKEDLSDSHQVEQEITDNFYISQIMSSDGDVNTYPLVSFDYDFVNNVITNMGGPFDETKRTLKNLFGPLGNYTHLNTQPDYTSLTLNFSQYGDDSDRDSGSYYGNLGLGQFESISDGSFSTICRGGNYGRANFNSLVDQGGGSLPDQLNEGVVAGVFSVRMINNDNETHAFRCVYHPLKRNSVLDTDRGIDSSPQNPRDPKDSEEPESPEDPEEPESPEEPEEPESPEEPEEPESPEEPEEPESPEEPEEPESPEEPEEPESPEEPEEPESPEEPEEPESPESSRRTRGTRKSRRTRGTRKSRRTRGTRKS